jgi:hypothetical protein
LNRNGGSTSLFDAFSLREPVSTPDQIRDRLSLENALTNLLLHFIIASASARKAARAASRE